MLVNEQHIWKGGVRQHSTMISIFASGPSSPGVWFHAFPKKFQLCYHNNFNCTIAIISIVLSQPLSFQTLNCFHFCRTHSFLYNWNLILKSVDKTSHPLIATSDQQRHHVRNLWHKWHSHWLKNQSGNSANPTSSWCWVAPSDEANFVRCGNVQYDYN